MAFHPKTSILCPSVLPSEAEYEQASGMVKDTIPSFIYMGRYAKYKGIDHTLVALGLLRKQYPNARLWLVGKPDQAYIETTLSPLCAASGMSIGPGDENAVVVKGYVTESEKFRLCAAARALLFPSVREGWGIIVSEAAIMGTPSIVFDTPGCRDAVDYGRAGYLCAENTPEDLARLMAETINDTTAYKNVCQSARVFAQSLSQKQTDEGFYRVLQRFSNPM